MDEQASELDLAFAEIYPVENEWLMIEIEEWDMLKEGIEQDMHCGCIFWNRKCSCGMPHTSYAKVRLCGRAKARKNDPNQKPLREVDKLWPPHLDDCAWYCNAGMSKNDQGLLLGPFVAEGNGMFEDAGRCANCAARWNLGLSFEVNWSGYQKQTPPSRLKKLVEDKLAEKGYFGDMQQYWKDLASFEFQRDLRNHKWREILQSITKDHKGAPWDGRSQYEDRMALLMRARKKEGNLLVEYGQPEENWPRRDQRDLEAASPPRTPAEVHEHYTSPSPQRTDGKLRK
ncbi:hypothetical protein CC80DRAFT_555540 [Byssothecium circinans]|uniref:Uncharacterized protein n=1 Tax=Byssothecium circinans TaxID=147558 RepID=A0A6A5TJQ9_9PLEO|nr:hypothetical protein CC80DRAFT_555540 [Byssothecium circinans]